MKNDEPFFNPKAASWQQVLSVETKSFICGYCGQNVSTDRGYRIADNKTGNQIGGIYICPNCLGPTFIAPDKSHFPSHAFGNSVAHVPTELNKLYEEARECTSHACYTATVLLCRKMLMNIAVAQGAKEGLNFIDYVNYLSDKGYTPPNGKHWVDHIRKKGNEANHEIALMTENDARELLVFTEMLLKFIYEFPSMVAKPTPEP